MTEQELIVVQQEIYNQEQEIRVLRTTTANKLRRVKKLKRLVENHEKKRNIRINDLLKKQ